MTKYNLEEFKAWLNADESRKSKLFKVEDALALIDEEKFSKYPIREFIFSLEKPEFIDKFRQEILEKGTDAIRRPYWQTVQDWAQLIDQRERERERERERAKTIK